VSSRTSLIDFHSRALQPLPQVIDSASSVAWSRFWNPAKDLCVHFRSIPFACALLTDKQLKMSSSRSAGGNPFNFSLSDITSKVGDFFGASEFSNPVGTCSYARSLCCRRMQLYECLSDCWFMPALCFHGALMTCISSSGRAATRAQCTSLTVLTTAAFYFCSTGEMIMHATAESLITSDWQLNMEVSDMVSTWSSHSAS
jgi:hypothetical protein